jgi:hypothetical protein
MRDLEPGTVVAGYRIEAVVGRGGMGVVYRAVQTGLNRCVALKVIAPELLDDESVRRRFLEEARAAASVDHPNVIPVHDAGTADGIAYIAMRFVEGSDLRSLVRVDGPLDPAEAAEVVAQAGAALDAIHRAGLVHRDVKPANLLVDHERHVYLTDFGLAKAVLTQTGGTRTGHWVGTLDYVAPEQVRGGRIDARADVYALGGVLHYALTARVPYDREGDEAKLWAHLSAPPPVPSAARPRLRREFDAAVARAMAKAPEERFPSAGDLGRAARAAVSGRRPTEPERMVARGGAAPGAAPSEPGLADEASTRTARPPGEGARRRGGWAAIVLGGAVALAAAVALALDDEPAGRAATDGTPTPALTATATSSAEPAPRGPGVVRKIGNVGDRPTGIAYAGGDVWVASSRSPFLTRIAARTGQERKQHPKVGVRATTIVGHGEDVWVANAAERVVIRLSARTGAERGRMSVPGVPRRLAVNRAGIWVAVEAQGTQPGRVVRYDRGTGAPAQTITVPEGVGAMAASADELWIVKHTSETLARLDPASGAFVDIVPAP